MFAPLENKYITQERDQALMKLEACYSRCYSGDDMFIADRNMSFYDDPKFEECMKLYAKGGPYPGMAWRMHILIWAMKKALSLSGDFMECGTFRGFKMQFLAHYFGDDLKDKKLFLVDTFEGIDPKQADGSPIKPQEHQKVGLYEFVKHRFSQYENVHIIKGAAPDSLDQADFTHLSFLHLDMNSYQAEIGVLERVWSSMPSDAVIVLDDFGLYSHRSQMEKELPWFLNKGLLPLELPTGQAIVVKS